MYLLFKVNDIVMKVANSILKILFWEWMCKVLKHFCVMGQSSLRPITPKKKGFKVWIEPQLIDTKSHHIYHHLMGSTCCESAWQPMLSQLPNISCQVSTKWVMICESPKLVYMADNVDWSYATHLWSLDISKIIWSVCLEFSSKAKTLCRKLHQIAAVSTI